MPEMKEHQSAADLIALDFSNPMLEEARKRGRKLMALSFT